MYMITEGMKVGGKVRRTGTSEGTFPLYYITDLILCFCCTEEGHCSPGARLCEKGLERDTGKTPVPCSLIRYLSTSTYWRAIVWFHASLQPDASFELNIELLQVIPPAEHWPFSFCTGCERLMRYLWSFTNFRGMCLFYTFFVLVNHTCTWEIRWQYILPGYLSMCRDAKLLLYFFKNCMPGKDLFGTWKFQYQKQNLSRWKSLLGFIINRVAAKLYKTYSPQFYGACMIL
jgi:hypothetical protein